MSKDKKHAGMHHENKEEIENNEEFNADNNSIDIENHENNDDQDQVMQLSSQLKEAEDKYLRLAAEFDNFRKRNMKERLELIKTASEDVIVALLDVLDDSERALEQVEKANDIPQIKEGIKLVFSKLKNILQQKGLKEMDSLGKEFNPDMHEAIAEIPAQQDEDAGKVLDQVSKGYLLNDKIIRHAKVVVGK